MYLAHLKKGSIASGSVPSCSGSSSISRRGMTKKQRRVLKKLLRSNNKNCIGYYYTGFFDAEGCFRVKIVRNKKYSIGWHIHPNFSIVSHKRDLLLLKDINEFLGGLGQIYVKGVNKGEGIVLEFNTMRGLRRVISHLNLYPLITQKRADYLLFKQVVEIVSRKEHLTEIGLQRIVSIRAALNRGLTDQDQDQDQLKNAFPNIVPSPRPLVEFKGIPNPYWFAGFVDGEGCFFVSVLKSISCKLGISVSLEFNVTQHFRDEELMKGFKDFLGCGWMKSYYRSPSLYFVVTKFTDIITKTIPFFSKYSLKSVKCLDFADFCKVAEIIQVKEHLTPSHKWDEQVRAIKAGMNKGRTFVDTNNRLRGTEKYHKKE